MSAQELVVIEEKMTPSSVASDLLAVIKDIELCIENANDHVIRIENRGWFKNVFSSDKTDLVDISRSQNKINEMMLGLIQEAITLNTMSYSFLAAVISELEQRARDGWTDAEGKFQCLSDTGRDFADKAQHIFRRIAEGSRNTQGRIELNEANIEEIKEALAAKEREVSDIQEMLSEKANRLAAIDALLDKKSALDNEQTQAIQAIVQELKENSRLDQGRAETMERLAQDLKSLSSRLADVEVKRLAAIDALLEKKSALDNEQSQAIQELEQELKENSRLSQGRAETMERLAQDLKSLSSRLADLESRSTAGHLRLRLGLSALAAATVVLAAGSVASLTGYL